MPEQDARKEEEDQTRQEANARRFAGSRNTDGRCNHLNNAK
jgi:hypothetical protein